MHEGVTLVLGGCAPHPVYVCTGPLTVPQFAAVWPEAFLLLALLPFTSGAHTQQYRCCYHIVTHPTQFAAASSYYRIKHQHPPQLQAVVPCSRFAFVLPATFTASLMLPSLLPLS